MYNGWSDSSCSGSTKSLVFFIASSHQISRFSVILISILARFRTITFSTVEVFVRASSTISLSFNIFPLRNPPSEVMTNLACESLIRSASAVALNPEKTTVNAAPIRVAASMATGNSGTIGM